jgi:hypothetical protein
MERSSLLICNLLRALPSGVMDIIFTFFHFRTFFCLFVFFEKLLPVSPVSVEKREEFLFKHPFHNFLLLHLPSSHFEENFLDSEETCKIS